MLKYFLLLTLGCFMLCGATAQTCPPNIDFEKGDFSSWETFTGHTYVQNGVNKISLTPSPAVRDRHQIISDANGIEYDSYGGFPTLCPFGGQYSVKLGNDFVSAEAEGLSYTFVVPTTVDTFTFTYFYAVVFEDPGHSLPEQPRFFVTAYDVATGDLINCASFDYVSNSAIPGFKRSSVSNGVLYKEWTPASLQFAGMKGRQVRLEFRTADCTLGGHFGYAYVDVASACSNILATAPYCIETNSLLLNAPYGFQSYTWYNSDYTQVMGREQSLTLSPPPATSGSFFVDVVPYPGFGCRDTLEAVVRPLPVPEVPEALDEQVYCQYQTPRALSAKAKPGSILLWYATATAPTGTSTPPVPVTNVAGTFEYFVSQKILFGCESPRKKIKVHVLPTPNVSFRVNAARQCLRTNQYTFTSTSTNRLKEVYHWDFGDGQKQASPKDSVVTHQYSKAGNFTVKLRVENEGACSREATAFVTVVPNPVAAFNFPDLICENQTPLQFTDKSSVPSALSTISGWWWNVNGVVAQTSSPSGITANAGGSVPVRLVVYTPEGCLSDTNLTYIKVRYQPTAALAISSPLCNNTISRFSDQSVMPAQATGEHLVRWNWKWSNNSNSSLQHPLVMLAPGNHQVQLVAESQFGCKSAPAVFDFVVHPKPAIDVKISDSCINRALLYKALDKANTVDKWFWDFGNGFRPGDSVVNKRFAYTGDQSFRLMALTKEGCRDTLVRPFAIFDNKTIAGRDTVAALNEPVQLMALGGDNAIYNWSPAVGLNKTDIKNPVALLNSDQRYDLYAETDKGCERRSSILIKRFAGPEIYIPTAFTPNGDGKNDVLRAMPVGMKLFKYFAVYNRYGELVFKTTNHLQGWDGRFRGEIIGNSTYVVLAEAIDYRGKPFVKRGTVTIIQ